jgi:O-succinylbenzoic acid--CoA ligase
VALRAYNQPATLLAAGAAAVRRAGAAAESAAAAALLQELLPALTVQHQLVLNGDALPGIYRR